jgi:hypothetical protein
VELRLSECAAVLQETPAGGNTMTITTAVAKLVSGKAKVLSTLGGLALAGVAMTVAAPAAKAQVAFGVEIGRPHYYAPVPERPVVVAPYAGYGYGYAPGYVDHRRYDDWRAREWRDHENWDRQRAYERDRSFRERNWR